jgi:hypothetical protein
MTLKAEDIEDFLLGLAPDSDVSFPEPEQFNGDDQRPMPSVESDDSSERRERDTSDLMAAMNDFAKDYGWSRVIEVAAWAMRDQGRLIR